MPPGAASRSCAASSSLVARSRASVHRRFCRRLLGREMAGGHARRTRSGPCTSSTASDPPQRRRPEARARAPVAYKLIRRDLRLIAIPPGPEGLRLRDLQQPPTPPAWLNSPRSASWRYPVNRLALRIALALLVARRPIPPHRNPHATARAGRSLRPTGATDHLLHRPARTTQKPQNDLTLARHRPSLAKSQRACRQSLAWGKRGRAKLARIYHRPINSNFLLKIIGHVPVLLGHFD